MWKIIQLLNSKVEDAGYTFSEEIKDKREGTQLYCMVNSAITTSAINDIANFYTYDFEYQIGIMQARDPDGLLCKEEKLDEVFNDIRKIILDSIGESGELYIADKGTGFKTYHGPKEYCSSALLSFLITYKYN